MLSTHRSCNISSVRSWHHVIHPQELQHLICSILASCHPPTGAATSHLFNLGIMSSTHRSCNISSVQSWHHVIHPQELQHLICSILASCHPPTGAATSHLFHLVIMLSPHRSCNISSVQSLHHVIHPQELQHLICSILASCHPPTGAATSHLFNLGIMSSTHRSCNISSVRS